MKFKAPTGKALFDLRLLQLKREPLVYLLALAGLFLALFSTRLAPLPPLEGGRVWAEFLLAGLQASLFLYALTLVLQPEGFLLGRLPPLPAAQAEGEFAWTLAECLGMAWILLPGSVLGWLLLPSGLKWALLSPFLVLFFQGFFLVSLAGFGRPSLGRGGGTVLLVGAWILVSLPPLSWADARNFSPGPLGSPGESLAGALLVWAGLGGLFLVLRPGRRVGAGVGGGGES